VSTVRLGLCCTRSGGFRPGPARSSLRNAVRFFRISQEGTRNDEGLTLALLDAGAEALERSLREAVENDVTHVLFLSPGAILPFYSLQSLLELPVAAVSGISWTWRAGADGGLPLRAGADGGLPDISPRIGFYDPEGRPFPYFGWSAPDIFEVDWCGLDCLLVEREAIEEIAEPLARLRHVEPGMRISQALRSRGIPILVDSFIQCPQVVRDADGSRRLIPSPRVWLEFSRDFPERRLPAGSVYDPAYRGRRWYREWVRRCLD
jgi:hypothetical protein